ncbi:MAG: CPBP family intramembrane glutamic endopeptidase [Anaerolineae bacterium]
MTTYEEQSPRSDWKTTVILVYATLALVLDFYNNITGRKEWDSLLLYLILPLLLIVVLRRPLTGYGFRAGKWKRGLLLTVGGWLLMAPVLWLTARGADFGAYYTRFWSEHGFWGTLLFVVKDLIGWEFFFRGLLLFTLADIAGEWAILLQAMIFTLAHLTKPQLETLSCIVGGSAFGWVAWETGSFFYPFLIHLFVTFFTIWMTQW